MQWQCANCKIPVEDEVTACPRCGATSGTGEPSRAVSILKKTIGSAPFLIAAVCLTLVFLLGVVLDVIDYGQVTKQDVSEIISVIHTEFPQVVNDETASDLEQLAAEEKSDTSSSFDVTLLLLIIGLWLLIGQQSMKKIRVNTAGIILIRVACILCLVAFGILFVCVAGGGALLWVKWNPAVKWLSTTGAAQIGIKGDLVSSLLSQGIVKTCVFAGLGALALILIIGILFYCFSLRGLHNCALVCKNGKSVGRGIPAFVPVILLLVFAGYLFSAVLSLLTWDMTGAKDLLLAIGCLMLAVVCFQYTGRVKKLVAFEAQEELPFIPYEDEPVDGVPVEAEPTTMAEEEPVVFEQEPEPSPYIAPDVEEEQTEEKTEEPQEIDQPIPTREDFDIEPGEEAAQPESEAVPTRTCPRCGAEVAENAFFCTQCGMKL